MNRLDDHLSPLDDDERAQLVREALAAAAIAKASRTVTDWEQLDPALEKVLARVTPRALNAMTLYADSPEALKTALREALREGLKADLIPEAPREYTDEELEL